jgi:hypothetical protein
VLSYRLAPLLLAALCAACSAVPEVRTAGHVAAEGRVFWQEPKYPGQEQGTGVSLVAEPELGVASEDEVHSATLRPFYRLDPYDSNRSHADLRKASYQVSSNGWEAGAGAGIFTWGVLESHRTVDVMNQIDFVDSADGSAKLGQPYASFGYTGETASLRLYYLPYFRERTFPGVDGRLRFAALIDGENAIYESDAGPWHPSGAARFTWTEEDLDVAVGVFSGISREPRFVVELTRARVTPRYDLMQQVSLDAQWTTGALALKLEGFARLWSAEFVPFVGGGVGLEYSFFDVVAGWDIGVAAELLLDARPLEAPITFFEHDAFGGLRLGFNDTASTELLAGAVVDVRDGATFGRVEAGRRFGEHWRVNLGASLFLGEAGKLESSFLEDDHVHGRVAYFF